MKTTLFGAGSRVQDFSFHSEALGRSMPFTLIRPASEAVAGWSMGGYGAVRFAERHPEEIGTVTSIIGLLDFPQHPISPTDGYKEIPARFGTDEAVWPDFNPIMNVAALQARRVQVVIAKASWDTGMNERFLAALRAREIVHEEVRLPGAHDFSVVEAALPQVVNFCARSFVLERRRQTAPLAGTFVEPLSDDTTADWFASFGQRTGAGEIFFTTEWRYRHNMLPEFLTRNTDVLLTPGWTDKGGSLRFPGRWSLASGSQPGMVTGKETPILANLMLSLK